jgi:hypothetical protein
MTGLAVATVAVGSGLQVALYLHRFGANHSTDGFIAAFAVYSPVVVIAQILRTTAVPLVSGASPRISRSRFGWAVVWVSVLVTVFFAGVAEPLSRLLTSATGGQARTVALRSLLVMAPAMGLQMAAAGLSVLGGLRDRLVGVAVAYMASAAVGLIAFFALVDPAGEQVLAYTLLTSSATLVAVLLVCVRPTVSSPPRVRSIIGAAGRVLRTAPIPASFILMYPLTLALMPSVRAGAITIFGLAFTAIAYLAGATGQALSMVRVFAFTKLEQRADDDRHELIMGAFRYSMLIAAPGIAVAIVAGQPLLRALLASRAHGGRGFATDLLFLIPWLVATLGMWATLPAVLAQTGGHSGRRTLAIVGALFGLHIGASLAGRAIGGFHGLILMLFAAPAAFTAASSWELSLRLNEGLAKDTIRIVALAATAFGVALLPLWAIFGSGSATGIASAVVGAALYGVFIALAFPPVGRVALGLVRR